MPKIGMPNVAVLSARLKNAVEMAADNMFDAFEIGLIPGVNLDRISAEDAAEIRDIAENVDMELCVHAPIFEVNIAAFQQGIREESIKSQNKAIDLCATLGGSIVIMHCGEYSYDSGPNATRENHPLMKRQWNNNIESLKTINDYAVNKGITVCLENLSFNRIIDKSIEDLLEIQSEVGESLKFTFDIGHARLNGNIQDGITKLGKSIRHIHLTDNFGEKDDHLPPGDGNIDYSDCTEFLKSFPHIITIEVSDMGKSPEPMIRGRDFFNQL